MVAAASRGVRESTCIHCAMTTDGTLRRIKAEKQICREPWIGDWALGKGPIAQIWEIRPPIGRHCGGPC